MKNKEIFNIVEEISKSQQFTQKTFDSNDDAAVTINLLRQNITKLISIIHAQNVEHKELREVTNMLQKIEKAKSRFVERAIDSTTKEDYHDAIPYGVKDRDIVKIVHIHVKKVNKIDMED